MRTSSTTWRAASRLAFCCALAAFASAPAFAQHVLEFDEFVEGEVVDAIDVQGCGTITVDASSNTGPGCTNNAAVIYFSEGEVGADPDLEVGEGNLLIIHEVEDDGECDELGTGIIARPDDDALGGLLTMTFPQDVEFCSLLVVDNEVVEAGDITLLDVNGNVLAQVNTPVTGDGGKATVTFTPCVTGVRQLVLDPTASRGWDDFTFFCEAPGGGCTLTQGYWKNHPEDWPVDNLDLGTVNYSQAQLLQILGRSVQGNGLVSLARQLIAAKLNVANGADDTDIAATIDDADALIGGLVVPPIGSGFLHPSQTSDLTDALDAFNRGVTGPGHCDQESAANPPSETTGTSSATPETFALVAPAPNPFRTTTSLRVALPEAAEVSVVVYDVLGREVARLADGTMDAGEHAVTWDAQGAPNGTYVVVLQTGTYREARTVVLAR